MNLINKIFTRFLFCAIMATLFIVALPTHKAFADMNFSKALSINKGFSVSNEVQFTLEFGGDIQAGLHSDGGEAGIDIDGKLHTPVGAVGIDFDCSASFSETIKICGHITTLQVEVIGGTSTGCALTVTADGKSLDFSNSGGTDVDVSLCVRMSPINNMKGVEMHVKAYGHLGFTGAFGAISIDANKHLSLFGPTNINFN